MEGSRAFLCELWEMPFPQIFAETVSNVSSYPWGREMTQKGKSCTLWLGKIGFHMNLLSATGEGLAAEGEQELLVEGESVRGCGTEGGGELEPKKSFGFLSPWGCRRAGLAAHLAAGPREYGAVPLRSHRTLLRIHRLGGSVLSS